MRSVKETQRLLASALLRPGPALRGNRNDFTGVVGTKFKVGAQSVTIDALGFEDADSDGLQSAHQVGIWNNAGELLASVSVPEGRQARFIAGWRYVALECEVQLAAGEMYTIGAEVSDGGDAWTDARHQDASLVGLHLKPGLAPASPADVFRHKVFGRPTSDGIGTARRLRWGTGECPVYWG